MNLKGSQEGCVGGFKGKEKEREMIEFYYNLKNTTMDFKL